MPGLRILLSQSSDPEHAVLSLESFAVAHPSEFQQLLYAPFGLQALVAVFSASRFLTEAVNQHPDWLFGLLASANLHRVKSTAQYLEQLEEWLGDDSAPPQPRRFAEYRRRRILRILLRDVMGFGALSEITEELSSIADAILAAAYRRLRLDLERRYGVPRLEDARPCGFSILALGKLGARELNYSSDIDLLFLYEGQGRTDGPHPISNAEFFKKLANQYTELLGAYTNEGLCYRVDLRLRPDGRLGEVCISAEGARDYYSRRARDWELQMLIKARAAAGEPEPGRSFLEWVEPRIYSTTLDFSAVEQMSATRERLTEKLNVRRRHSGIDVKLCRGGIRDIEFLVQCLQRLHGGRAAWLRNSTTLLALARLRDKDILSDREYSHLATAYQFLRHLEHRLQFDEDRQTHTLPEQPDQLAMAARRMPPGLLGGASTAEALLAALNHHCERVAEIYERVVHSQQPLYYTQTPVPAELPASAPEPASWMAEAAASNLVRLLDQKAPRLAAVVARARLARCRTTLEHFLEAAVRHSEWLAALDSDSALAGWLLDLFEHSPFLSEQLVRAPELFEELRGLRACGLDETAVEDLVSELEDASEIRRFFRRQMFRILAGSICLQDEIFKTLDRCTRLADSAIAACYRIAVQQAAASIAPVRPGYVPSNQMMVIALGRLGMKEFDLGSDADLVFVIPDSDAAELPLWTRVAEKLIEILSSYTRDGVMFAVDTRLRPNGRSGALVQTQTSVRDYFARQAEAWEGIAYMKARTVAGDLERGTRFLTELQKVDWRRYGQSGRSRKELRLMRLRLEKELGSDNPLKTSAGGYYDIDFALLYLRLKGAGMFYPALNTPERIEVIENMGHLEPADAHFLRDAATFYRAVDHGLRIMSGHAEGALPKAEGPAQMLTELVSRWVAEHLVDQPLAIELQQIQTRTREFFDRLFEA
jgi:glutamate-ammonia-ligase adenylyltransferase